MGIKVSITVKLKLTDYIIPDEDKSQDSLAPNHAPTPPADHPIKRRPSTPVATATIKRQKKIEKAPPKKPSPKPSYFEALIQVNGLFYCQRYTEAHTLYEKVLDEDPHHLTALYRQSVCFWKRGFINQALSNLKQLLVRHPKDEHALAIKGALLIQKSQLKTALEELKKSASLNPSSDFIQSVLLENCYYAFRQPP